MVVSCNLPKLKNYLGLRLNDITGYAKKIFDFDGIPWKFKSNHRMCSDYNDDPVLMIVENF